MYKIIVKLETRDEVAAPMCYGRWGAIQSAHKVADRTGETVHVVDTDTNEVIWKNN